MFMSTEIINSTGGLRCRETSTFQFGLDASWLSFVYLEFSRGFMSLSLGEPCASEYLSLTAQS